MSTIPCGPSLADFRKKRAKSSEEIEGNKRDRRDNSEEESETEVDDSVLTTVIEKISHHPQIRSMEQ